MNRLQLTVYEILEDLYYDTAPLPFSDLVDEVNTECSGMLDGNFVQQVVEHPESDYRLMEGNVFHLDDIPEPVAKPEEEKTLLVTIIIP